ncbi:hypothetical protein AMTRI_Chr06g173030 [Amborella trichopoda]|uniref:Rapid ALkalinization Factor n=1 Tax=Amborella trichopoda TaxID=13333 RepID=W1NQE6_AMBTC|nr:hypothetical protein AMTR_s00117p00131230 [Amborella trichopoda]
MVKKMQSLVILLVFSVPLRCNATSTSLKISTQCANNSSPATSQCFIEEEEEVGETQLGRVVRRVLANGNFINKEPLTKDNIPCNQGPQKNYGGECLGKPANPQRGYKGRGATCVKC